MGRSARIKEVRKTRRVMAADAAMRTAGRVQGLAERALALGGKRRTFVRALLDGMQQDEPYTIEPDCINRAARKVAMRGQFIRSMRARLAVPA